MKNLRHVLVTGTADNLAYTSRWRGGQDFAFPPRDDRVGHGTALANQITAANDQKREKQVAAEANFDGDVTVLEFQSEPDFLLKLDSLDRRSSGIELLNAHLENGITVATVRVPDSKLSVLFKLLEQYAKEDSPKSGKPKNQQLVESISSIRLAALPSFWTDRKSDLPEPTQAFWWEIWLRDDNSAGIVEAFQAEGKRIGLRVGNKVVRFPERIVLIAFGTLNHIAQFKGLFSVLAELRRAIEVPTAYLSLALKDQADFVDEAVKRIEAPSESAPAVCILDTGVNSQHPLLSIALNDEHVLACDPAWNPADKDGHGTGMAGIALYGCLTSLFATDEHVRLEHRLESVKILPDHGRNAPENYGAITAEAIALAEIASPTRSRAICMAVTGERCEEGLPSSWSSEIDQLAAGVHDDRRRLILVSAGNIREALTAEDYPSRNHIEGIEDPAQSWNALTVGACTDKVHISSTDFDGYVPIGHKGRLCPTSRTSLIWEKKEWPIKPDIVLEGGNTAAEAAGGHGSFIEDLALLTTRVAPTGALLTHFCETSAATALAARMAAQIQSRYDSFWPETVRGLLVHSADWTPEMKAEFPYEVRHHRLRCYGYGVPNLEKALASASNAVTLILQERLQPYDKVGSDIKHKEMHIHELPWPVEILQSLGELNVCMKVTLSYFVDPSPGRRGWTNKHRYQSFGLRFDTKRPTESLLQFKQRINPATWEDPDQKPVSVAEDREWDLKENLRTRGSIHSDRWNGTAAQLAASGAIAVYPIIGWWRERPHLEGWRKSARYALIVTIESPHEDVDLYTPIVNAIAAQQEVEIDT